jgi:hypothetical protein
VLGIFIFSHTIRGGEQDAGGDGWVVVKDNSLITELVLCTFQSYSEAC